MTENVEFRAVLIDGVLYERRPDGSLAPIKGESDWARVDAMTNDEIEAIAAGDEDSPPLTDEEWEQAVEHAKRLGLGRFAPKPVKVGRG